MADASPPAGAGSRSTFSGASSVSMPRFSESNGPLDTPPRAVENTARACGRSATSCSSSQRNGSGSARLTAYGACRCTRHLLARRGADALALACAVGWRRVLHAQRPGDRPAGRAPHGLVRRRGRGGGARSRLGAGLLAPLRGRLVDARGAPVLVGVRCRARRRPRCCCSPHRRASRRSPPPGSPGAVAPPLIATARTVWPRVAGPELTRAGARAQRRCSATPAPVLGPAPTGALASRGSGPRLVARGARRRARSRAAVIVASLGVPRATGAGRRRRRPAPMRVSAGPADASVLRREDRAGRGDRGASTSPRRRWPAGRGRAGAARALAARGVRGRERRRARCGPGSRLARPRAARFVARLRATRRWRSRAARWSALRCSRSPLVLRRSPARPTACSTSRIFELLGRRRPGAPKRRRGAARG